MFVSCPTCHSKAKIIAKKAKGKKKSLLVCQCINLNCSSTFELSLSMIGDFSRKPKVAA